MLIKKEEKQTNKNNNKQAMTNKSTSLIAGRNE
jgi:hypothetical protein